MSTDEYVPSDEDVCNVYVDYYMQHSGKTHSEANAEFVRFIERYTARVRRDAALSTYAAAYRAGWLDGQNGSPPDPRMAYPEESP